MPTPVYISRSNMSKSNILRHSHCFEGWDSVFVSCCFYYIISQTQWPNRNHMNGLASIDGSQKFKGSFPSYDQGVHRAALLLGLCPHLFQLLETPAFQPCSLSIHLRPVFFLMVSASILTSSSDSASPASLLKEPCTPLNNPG